MASGSKTVKVTNYNNLVFNWRETSQSIPNNTTTVYWEMLFVALGKSGKIDSSRQKEWRVSVNGNNYSGTATHGIEGNSTITLASGSTVIPHNADGSKTFSYSFFMEFTGLVFAGVAITDKSGSGTGTLTTIPRKATITAAPNFNDEANPTITYKNSAGNAVTSLRACISLDGSKDDVAYRAISKTGTSYTFNLTTAERNVLRNATTTSNSRTVRFYVETVIGGETYRDNISKTFTIINANPVVNPSFYDTDAAVVALTGNNNVTMINYSNVYYALNATAQKGATIKSYKVSNTYETKTTATGTFNNTKKASIYYEVTDSRGNVTKETVVRAAFTYTPLTSKIKGDLTTGGDMTINISGNYFNNTFGAVKNTLTLEYRFKESGGSWGTWEAVTPTLGTYGKEMTYTAAITKNGLDYRKTYSIQARATDKMGTVTTAEYQIMSYPIFDWGENDFKFNVPVALSNGTPLQGKSGSGDNVNLAYITTGTSNLQVGGGAYAPDNIFINTKDNAGTVSINGKAYGVNRVLWSGSYYMTEGQTANLTEPVSAQTSGIILVFSRYDIANSAPLNEHFSSHFIPKQLVALQEGKGSVFNMNTATYSYAGSKYLYIDDTAIRGNANNDAVGTGENGISYNNNRYVLRYVIGV